MGAPTGRIDRGFLPVLTIGTGLWLLFDALRVWLPSLITVFGQAGTTPPQAIGLFALGWFLAPLPVLFLRSLLAGGGDEGTEERSPRLPLDVWFAFLLGAVRLALQATGGGQLQLYVASTGVFAGLVWLATIVSRARRSLLRGAALGIALSTLTHAALGTHAAVWRPGVLGWVIAGAQVLLFWWLLTRTPRLTRGALDGQAADPVLCFLLPPALLISGVLTASPARAEAAAGWPDGWAAATVAAAVAVGFVLSGASATPWRTPVVPGAVLVAAVAVAAFSATEDGGVPGLPPSFAVLAQAVGALALIACLAWADWPGARGRTPREGRAGAAVLLGGLVFLGVLFGYYAGYDLGYRADALLVAVAVLIAVTAAVHGRRKDRDSGSRVRRPFLHRRPGAVVAAAGTAATVFLLPSVTTPAITSLPAGAVVGSSEDLRVVSYNLRMGYGMDGGYDLEGVAETILRADPDVVLLSEVDRGWFLNGGQDTLGVLSDTLDMEAVFAPAADQVWGDAVLTRLPVVETVGHRLRSYGAPIGAQALSVVVEHEGAEIEVISTHLQPPVGKEPTMQAADLADIVIERTGLGRPVVVGGDLNFTPNSAAWREMERAGLYDALFQVRPAPTFPADAPEQEIDHIFATEQFVRRQAAAVPTAYSDHLPVMAVLRLERPMVYGT